MTTGVFGKYPGRRDFLAMHLPRSVVVLFENWLQTAIAISRERFGRRWSDYYSVHPIWNFRIGAEIAGVDCMGALMPSVDGVGRLFPLSLIAHAAPGARFASYPDIPSDWIEDVHTRLLAALAETPVTDPEDFVRGLADPPPGVPRPEGIEPVRAGYRMRLYGAYNAERARFAEQARMEGEARSAVFWTAGGGFVAPQVIATAGMPDPGLYGDMICAEERPEHGER